MPQLDIDSLVNGMLAAAKGSLSAYWQTAEPIAKAEFTRLTQIIAKIGEDRLTGTITPEDARDLLAEEADASAVALDTQIGLGEVAAQDAINAALAAISGAVNGYLGFVLI
jgi:hypothetical protein